MTEALNLTDAARAKIVDDLDLVEGTLWRHERAQVSDSLLFSPRLVGLAASSVQRAGFGAMRLVPTKTAAVRFVPQWFDAAGHVCDLEGLLMPLRDDESEEAPHE